MRRVLALGVVTVVVALSGCGSQQPEAQTGVMDGGQRGAIITNHKGEPLNKVLFDAGMQPILYEREFPTDPGVVFMPITAPPFVAAGCSLADDEALAKCSVLGYFDHPNAFRGLKKSLRGQAIDTFNFSDYLAVYGRQKLADGRVDTYTCVWAQKGKSPSVLSITAMPAQVKRQMVKVAGRATLEKVLTIDGVGYNCSRVWISPGASPSS